MDLARGYFVISSKRVGNKEIRMHVLLGKLFWEKIQTMKTLFVSTTFSELMQPEPLTLGIIRYFDPKSNEDHVNDL